jgi:predicted ATPase/DNA-binding SARP family transcriptional activator
MLEIRLFGRPEVRLGPAPRPVQARAMSLLGYLVVHRERPLPREAVACTFWPDLAEDDARAKLRWYLHYLRNEALPQTPNGAWILADKRTLQWNAEAAAWLDVAEFERLSSQPAGVAEAVDLYGDLMSGFDDEWLEAPRAHLRERQIALLLALIDECRRKNDSRAAIAYAQRLLAVDPWREDAVVALVDLRRETGDRAGALAAYREFASRLETELGVTPSGETTAAYERAVAAEIRVSLPCETTSFIGREAEVAQVQSMLAASRLLTLTGAGGVGKTRMAIAVARAAAPFYPDGVWFVDLAALGDPLFVAPALLTALGLREQSGRDSGDVVIEWLRERSALLVFDNCEHLVAEAARVAARVLGECANARIIATSREVLGTSGEVLYRIPPFAEKEGVALFVTRAQAQVPAFKPSAANVDAIKAICTRLDGIPLAIELAAARISMMTVEQLRERLDERFRLLTGGARTTLARQQTLHDLIDWSYGLLSAQERTLLQRLAVFAGEFSLAAATNVAAFDSLDANGVFDSIAHLIDKSLLQSEPRADGQRYRLLESTKAFAGERAIQSGVWPALQRRYAEYFVSLAEASVAYVGSARYDECRRQISAEYDDYRATLQWALSAGGDVRLAGRMASALADYWADRQGEEGRLWSERVIERGPDGLDSKDWIVMLMGLARQYFVLGDYAKSTAASRRAEEAAIAGGDRSRALRARGNRAAGAFFSGRYEEAESAFRESLSDARAIGDRYFESVMLGNLADLASTWRRDFAAAEELYAQAVVVGREHGDTRHTATVLGDWSQTAADQGAFERAERLASESLELYRKIGSRDRITEQLLRIARYRMMAGRTQDSLDPLREAAALVRSSLHPLNLAGFIDASARLAATRGWPDIAATLYGFADAWRSTKALPRPPAAQELYAQAIASLREALDDTAFDAAFACGRAYGTNEALALCEAVTGEAP